MTRCMGTGATEEIKMKNKKNYSKEFKDFILALQAWIEEGCPQAKPFYREDSVCFQISHLDIGDKSFVLLEDELEEALEITVGDTDLPFNNSTTQAYTKEMTECFLGHYGNPLRLAWIKMMADTFKAEEETK